MEKYLTNLLELNSRVIVPDLGAFIIRQQDPKELVFNDLLAFDDGMLTDQLVQEEKLSKAEAQNRIRQFVEKLKKELREGKSYQMENLGSLKMDATSKIHLVSAEESEEELIKQVGTLPDSSSEEGPVETIEPVPKKRGKKIELKEPIEEEQKASEEEPETETEAETEAEAKPEPKEPAVEEPEASETDMKAETVAVEDGSLPGGEEGGFILEEVDSEVEVDATREEVPLEPDGEEPPFQFDEVEKDDLPDEFNEVIATESTEHETITDEEILQKQEEQFTVQVEGVPVSLESEKDPFKAYSQPSHHRRKLWPRILGSVLLIVILLVAAWFVFPEKVSRFLPENISQILRGDESGVTEPEIELTDEAQQEEITEEQAEMAEGMDELVEGTNEPAEETDEMASQPEEIAAVPEESSQEPETISSAGKKYYVVAGCFADIRNAENYVRTLRDQGYDASIFGKRDNLHAVCFSAHSSRQAASEELVRIRTNFDPAAWLLYY